MLSIIHVGIFCMGPNIFCPLLGGFDIVLEGPLLEVLLYMFCHKVSLLSNSSYPTCCRCGMFSCPVARKK